jgi:hypothetical protein
MRFVDIASSNRMATDSTNRLERSLALFYVVPALSITGEKMANAKISVPKEAEDAVGNP